MTSIDDKVIWGEKGSSNLHLFKYSSPTSISNPIDDISYPVFVDSSMCTSLEYFNGGVYSTTEKTGFVEKINKHNWE